MFPGKTPSRRLVERCVLGLACYLAARAALWLNLPGSAAAAVWPSTGIGLAGLMLLGVDAWPAVAAAALAARLPELPLTASGVAVATALAASATVEQVAAALLIRRLSPSGNPFDRPRDAIWFVVSAVACCAFGAESAVLTLRAADLLPTGSIGPTLLTWWVADLAGMIILAPPIFLVGVTLDRPLRGARLIEFAVIVALTFGMGEILFAGWSSPQFAVARPFIPLLLWAAFRFGQRETSTLAALLTGQAIVHTWHAAQAPLSGRAATNIMAVLLIDPSTPPHEWLRALQLFMCASALVVLVVASAVAERTASTRALHASEERLRTERMTRRLLETQKFESLGRVAGGIAHDFSNLLTPIIGNASLAALEVEPDSTVGRYLARINKSGEQAVDLCRQMLAYSGRGKLEVVRVDINTAIAQVQELLRAAVARNVRLTFELADELPEVDVDASQIHQLLMNLVLNASEAIDGGGSIVVRTSRGLRDAATDTMRPGSYVVVEVNDDGPGMDDHTRTHCFEPFFTTKFIGRGLGLAAAQGIARGHRGDITVDSEPGRGSIFRTYLPAVSCSSAQSVVTVS